MAPQSAVRVVDLTQVTYTRVLNCFIYLSTLHRLHSTYFLTRAEEFFCCFSTSCVPGFSFPISHFSFPISSFLVLPLPGYPSWAGSRETMYILYSADPVRDYAPSPSLTCARVSRRQAPGLEAEASRVGSGSAAHELLTQQRRVCGCGSGNDSRI